MGRPRNNRRGAEIADLYRQGLTVKEISDKMKVAVNTVLYYLHSRGVKIRTDKRTKGVCVNPSRLEEMKTLYLKEKKSLVDIGCAFGMTPQGVHSFLVRWGIAMRPVGRKKRRKKE